MNDTHPAHQKNYAEFSSFHSIDKATHAGRKEIARMGVALLFIVGIMLFTYMQSSNQPGHIMLVIAAMIGGYMALNIGANDVANNVGPAVGSHALTMVGAILIAGIFEAMGALIAGGEVVGTIKKGIINPEMIPNGDTFVWLMMGALLAGAIWLNIATAIGAPVSTTHSIVGGVLGAGIAAGGWGIADWDKVSAIAASWVISPVLGGMIAAVFLMMIKKTITYRPDMITAARKMVPIFISIMVWAFSTYLLLKGLKKIWKVDFMTAAGLGFVAAAVLYLLISRFIHKASEGKENSKETVNNLFTIPLIFAAAMLSFAHGANDVANAVGPLAAINDSIMSGGVAAKAAIPLWVMMVGAVGIVIGLSLYGPKLIKTVGSEITELDKTRAFCIAMAAAITVIIASQLGLPVSSTHIAVGGIFGVGFLREYLKKTHAVILDEIKSHHEGADQATIDAFLNEFQSATLEYKHVMLKELKEKKSNAQFSKRERKSLRKVYHQELVKRSALLKIAAAWIITVPVSGLMAAMLFFMMRGMMMP